MSLSKYLSHRQKPLVLPCAKISSEVQVKIFSNETFLNGEIYVSSTVSPPESHLLVRLPHILPLVIGVVIGWLPPLLDSSAKSAIEALVASEALSRSIQRIRWILMTRNRGRGEMLLPMTPPPITPLPLTPPPLTLPSLTPPLRSLC